MTTKKAKKPKASRAALVLLAVTFLLMFSCSCFALKTHSKTEKTSTSSLVDQTLAAHGNGAGKIMTPKMLLHDQECKEMYFEQQLDHFSYMNANQTFQQRYFIYDKFWRTRNGSSLPGPVLFYAGNEADVTLYVNATGFIWENAPTIGALVIFAEHRYYGKSQPFTRVNKSNIGFLSSEQALADYAVLLEAVLGERGACGAPVVAVGGSYGGMLATWLRLKYPHLVAGALAASAPIWHFLGDHPGPDTGAYYRIVTRAASAEGGAAPHCAENVRASWDPFFKMGKTKEGRAKLQQSFRLCQPLSSEEDVMALAQWIQEAWSSMAMGNYPYESSYLLNGKSTLPAWPMRVACSSLADEQLQNSPEALFAAHADAVGLYYNSTKDQTCYDWSSSANGANDIVYNHWDYQYCTEMFMPLSTDGVEDMFWPSPFCPDAEAARCWTQWGVRPRETWAATQYGGHRLGAASRLLFSNGLLDPWSGTGVPAAQATPARPALTVPEGAHHLDLMFSHPKDPKSVREVRKIELSYIQQWIDQEYNSFYTQPNTLSVS